SLRNKITTAVTTMPPAINNKSMRPPEDVSAALRALNPERSGRIRRPQILCGLATGIFLGNGVR
ncbi:MAG TPA: hypothetical protein PJ986_16040, partial [Gammaproteobacteria bacterium]|nr:hypothetical protein [Gammaproteobacteria bacterium]